MNYENEEEPQRLIIQVGSRERLAVPACYLHTNGVVKRGVLSFSIQPLQHDADVLALTPVISGMPLTDLVTAFEKEHGFKPVGGYGGLIPTWFAYGPLDVYFMAQSADIYWERGYYLLGCQCGEVGCWPLVACVSVADDSAVWEAFGQPHRPNRDYSDFGPFTFDLDQYRTAVTEVASQFPGRSNP